jgi:nucleoside-diphosphate-sugar epimerase
VQLIADKIGWDGHVNWNTKPKRPGEIYLLNSTNNKITARLGWYPKIDLSTGLDRTIEVWKNIVDNDLEFNAKKKFSVGK